jgi:hypothetical protein
MFHWGRQTDVQGSKRFACRIFDEKPSRHVQRGLWETFATDAKGCSVRAQKRAVELTHVAVVVTAVAYIQLHL